MLLAQLPSWFDNVDDWLIVLFVLVLPALGKVAQWIRDLQQGRADKEVDGELVGEETTTRKPARGQSSLPQPFETISSESDRMEKVPPPPVTKRPEPAKAWQPRPESMESPRPKPAPPLPKPAARQAQARPAESPRTPAPAQKSQTPRRTPLESPRRPTPQKQAVREVVDMVARRTAPGRGKVESDPDNDEHVALRQKLTAAAAPVERGRELASAATLVGKLDHEALRRAFILREILDPPVGMR